MKTLMERMIAPTTLLTMAAVVVMIGRLSA